MPSSHSTIRRRAAGAALLALLLAPVASALQQEEEAARQIKAVDDPAAYRIQFKEQDGLDNGRVAMIEGTATPGGIRFVAENLSILQPVALTVLARDPSDDIRVSLSKYRYDQADRSGTTKGTGMYTTKLRTQGDLKVVVASPDRRPFQLVVWAGGEVERSMKPVVVSNPARVRGEEAGIFGLAFGGGSLAVWVIAGALVVIAGLLGVIVMRGKRS